MNVKIEQIGRVGPILGTIVTLNVSLTSVRKNLEHRLVTLTESFSPLESELHNLPC